MALHNLARMTSSTTGTGTLTLGSAVSGFLSFADAGVVNAEKVTYAIRDGANSEIGRGTYTASGTTLSRDTVLESTNSGNKITCSGSQEVFIAAAAEDVNKEVDYAEITSTATITATTLETADTVITGNAVTYDGVTPVLLEFYCGRAAPSSASGGRYLVIILLEDSTVLGNLAFIRTPATGDFDVPVHCSLRRTPSSGSHTYTVKAWVNGGTGYIYAEGVGSGNVLSSFLRITRAN